MVRDAMESAPPSLVRSEGGAVPMLRSFVAPDRVEARRLRTCARRGSGRRGGNGRAGEPR